MNPADLDGLYEGYRFDRLRTKAEGVRAYGLTSGYFVNADIVPVEPGADVEAAKADLEAAGYACTVRRYTSLEDAEEHLFSGFFAAESSRLRLRQDYDRFRRQASDAIGAPNAYQYVSGPFDSDAGPAGGDVVTHVIDLFNRPNPTLVILEAAAGFGKTCTSYEVLDRLLAGNERQLPIVTEFSLNRRAEIFRYVLLDEIDRNFPTLSSDLVLDQVRRGRTPLILDGFDELLSAGLGNDAAFEEIEPMLETIGQLLEEQAKVLLTTRSTAIFSDKEFERWLARRPGSFDVVRVRLRRPSIVDWLGHERINRLEQCEVPIGDLANPVLLAYLKHLGDDEFGALCADPHAIVARYFDSLMEREMNRQALRLEPAWS